MEKPFNLTADRIKAKREELQYSQDMLAKHCAVSKSTVKNWEAGVHFPGGKDLLRLAKILHTSPNYLLGFDDIDLFTIESPSFEEKQMISRIHHLYHNQKNP